MLKCSAQKTVLQRDRSRAVQRKLKQYLTDPDFRRSYRNNVYYNVNQDVPPNENENMHGHTVLVYDEEANRMNRNRSFYGPETQRKNLRVKLIENPNRTLQTSGYLDETITGRYSARDAANNRSHNISPVGHIIIPLKYFRICFFLSHF